MPLLIQKRMPVEGMWAMKHRADTVVQIISVYNLVLMRGMYQSRW